VLAVTLGGSLVAVSAGGASAAAPLVLTPSSFTLTWSAGPLPDALNPIAEGSPMVASLDSAGPSVVVGDRSGDLYAFHLADGTAVAGWPVDTGAPIDSTPSVQPTSTGRDQIFVGTGNAFQPNAGGYRAYSSSGTQVWQQRAVDPPADFAPAAGVEASLTVAPMQGGIGVYAGTLGQESEALSAANGRPLTGWPFFTADSTFSTAAAADLYGTGQTDLVAGGASTAGAALGQIYPQGGHLRILNSEGGLICHYDTNQEIDSSPAVGAFLSGGATGIVTGTGQYWAGASDTNTVQAFDTHCNRVWSTRLDGVTTSSPALAAVEGNGRPQVVEGTDTGSGGSVWVLDAATGQPIWHQAVTGRVIGSVVTADLTDGGYQDLIVPTTFGTDVLDGRTGALITQLSDGGFQNAPLVTDDPNGTVGITIAGYNGNNQGIVDHYEIPGSNGAAAVGAGSWPMFHHDPRLSGVSQVGPLRPAPACTVPAAARPGYDLLASDGGVFSYGQPFCGSTGGVRLARPVVGGTTAPGTGGYWMVASDGGIFSFGDAGFFGSTGGVRLARPVVGMAATPDGRGYWMVASDGGIFSFGDAGFFGSTGGVKLAHPIVAMAEDRATGGYWLVGSDGGVFAFGAPFLGSTGAVRLQSPIVGITSTEDGRGYWLVAADGGVFAFGDAGFYGSTGGVRLSRPVVGLLGTEG
jgi:PQQ-like domain